jgi:hypothetical protein
MRTLIFVERGAVSCLLSVVFILDDNAIRPRSDAYIVED